MMNELNFVDATPPSRQMLKSGEGAASTKIKKEIKLEGMSKC
jgi:hypothetical protein